MLYHAASRFDCVIEEKEYSDIKVQAHIILPMDAHKKKIMQILQNILHLDAETHSDELAESSELQFLGEQK